MAFRLKSGKTRAFRNGKPSGFGVREIFESLLDFVYPPTCLLCETRLEEEAHLCAACWETLADSLNPRVQKGREDFRHFTGTIFFDAVVTCWEYTPSVETIIHRLKYERGRKLGLCIARAIQRPSFLPRSYFSRWMIVSTLGVYSQHVTTASKKIVPVKCRKSSLPFWTLGFRESANVSQHAAQRCASSSSLVSQSRHVGGYTKSRRLSKISLTPNPEGFPFRKALVFPLFNLKAISENRSLPV